jgi:hypothetical protein
MSEEKLIHLLTATDGEVEEVRNLIADKIGKRPHPESARLIAVVKRILAEHKQYGKLTVRQVYYQLVTRGVIENSVKSYHRYDNHLTTGRKGGVIPWDAFEDRARVFYKEPAPSSTYDIGLKKEKDALKSWFKYVLNPEISEYYNLYKWENQPLFVELWVEKDALAGFLSPLCNDLGVGLVVSRGYTSYTFKQEAIQRFDQLSEERDPVLLYLGDLDPSGYDIYRCLKDEIDNAAVERIGLHSQDVTQFSLVPNPIKDTDTRAKGFKNLYPELGDNVYELDALPPGELVDRARRNILKYFDADIDEENKRRVRHWRANFVDIQEKYRKRLKKIGIDFGN